MIITHSLHALQMPVCIACCDFSCARCSSINIALSLTRCDNEKKSTALCMRLNDFGLVWLPLVHRSDNIRLELMIRCNFLLFLAFILTCLIFQTQLNYIGFHVATIHMAIHCIHNSECFHRDIRSIFFFFLPQFHAILFKLFAYYVFRFARNSNAFFIILTVLEIVFALHLIHEVFF